MISWDKRPAEISNLLNPAFGAVLIYQFNDGYKEVSDRNTPYILIYTILPFILHAQTRLKLPKRYDSRTKLIAFLHKFPEIKAGLSTRIISLKPISREAFIFGLNHKTFKVDENGLIQNTSNKINGNIWDSTSEPYDCYKNAKLLGKILGNSGDIASVCTILGIMP